MSSSARWSAILGGCCAALVTAPASASTVRVVTDPVDGFKYVELKAADGEVNSVSPYIGVDTIQMQDGFGLTGPPLTFEPPCTAGTSPNLVLCPKSGVGLIVSDLGDEDDYHSGMIYTLPVLVLAARAVTRSTAARSTTTWSEARAPISSPAGRATTCSTAAPARTA